MELDLFRTREPRPIGTFRKSAVMLLVQETEEGQYLILEKRAMTLRSQPGDISLPGGRLEEGESLAQAAVRETCEELGLKEEDLEVVGPMDYYFTHFGAIIYPFVARTRTLEFLPNPPEVAEIIRVPIPWLMEQVPDIYPLKIKPELDDSFPYEHIQGGRNYKFSEPRVDEYFYHFGDNHIWGTTARIINQFLTVLKDDGEELER